MAARLADLADLGFRWTAHALRQAQIDGEFSGAVEVLHAGLFAQLETSRFAESLGADVSDHTGRLAAAANIMVDLADDCGIDLGDEDPRACRICGCTEAHACEGGCWWVEMDLCSNPACVAKAAELAHAAKLCDCRICGREGTDAFKGGRGDDACSPCTRIMTALREVHDLGATGLAAALASAQGCREFRPLLVEAIGNSFVGDGLGAVLQRILSIHDSTFKDGSLDCDAMGKMASAILRSSYADPVRIFDGLSATVSDPALAQFDELAERHHGRLRDLPLHDGRHTDEKVGDLLDELRDMGATEMADAIAREGVKAGAVFLAPASCDAERVRAILFELAEVMPC